MEEIEINSIALIISFIIWIDIDITVLKKIVKREFKTKAEKFREKAAALGNYVVGRCSSSSYFPASRDSDGTYHSESYIVTYEYEVKGKKYRKNVSYSNSNYPASQNIYYKAGKPKKSIAETEIKFGFLYSIKVFIIPLSIFGISITAVILTQIINMFF